MTIQQIAHQVAADELLRTMLVAIAIDLALGVAAAFKLGTFRLAYLTNFMRNDVLGKVVPWAALDIGAIVAGDIHVVIPQFDLTNTAKGAGTLIVAALVGSIIGSLRDLGFLGAGRAPDAVAGSGRTAA